MPKQETHVPVVREWLISLGILTAVSMTRLEAELRLSAYLPLLMDEFPDAAFTKQSLQHVARQCDKGLPTYPELAKYLSAWWRKNRPVLALPPPDPPPRRPEPSEEEMEHVRRVTAETLAALRSSAQQHDDELQRLWGLQERRARYLDPEMLDRINPLPGGRKRVVSSPTIDAESVANDEDDYPPSAA